jgi:hypothetical protein
LFSPFFSFSILPWFFTSFSSGLPPLSWPFSGLHKARECHAFMTLSRQASWGSLQASVDLLPFSFQLNRCEWKRWYWI